MTSKAPANGGNSSNIGTPEKLRDDAIIEALCLLSFTSLETANEVVIGRLSDLGDQGDFNLVRLPFADIPLPVRQADATLRSQPILELRKKDGIRIVRLNESTLSYHLIGAKNYCGWSIFREELESIFSNLFKKIKGVEVRQIGFRYINAIVKTRHHIADVHELNFETKIAGKQLIGPINLNLVEENGAYTTTTRVAHPRFVNGKLPQDTVAVIDVEVTTPAKFTASNIEAVMDWIEQAHKYEKEGFFRLIPPDVMGILVEK